MAGRRLLPPLASLPPHLHPKGLLWMEKTPGTEFRPADTHRAPPARVSHALLGSRGPYPGCNDVLGQSDQLIALHRDSLQFWGAGVPVWELTKSGVDRGCRQESLAWNTSLKLTTEIYWQRKGRERLEVRMSDTERKVCERALRSRRV